MRHMKRKTTKARRLTRTLIMTSLVAALLLGSVVTAVANAVDITVFDGDDTYSFSMIGADAQSILARAETEGMEPLAEIDECVFSESSTVLTIQRNVRVSVGVDGTTQLFVVEEGTRLEDLLAQNGVALGKRDSITPAADTVLTADTEVEIRRSHRVFVTADGTGKTVDVIEGTVADALQAADVTLRKGDRVSPEEDTLLADGMEINVSRMATVTVTADGEETTADVLAQDVQEAIDKMDVQLDGDDLIYLVSGDSEVLISRDTHVKDGMTLRVERITKETLTVSETIGFDTVYEEVEGKYKDEQETVTRGVNGEKQVTYEVVYADGVEIEREKVSEEILKEAVDAVIRRGTEVRADAAGNSTFVDHTGTTVGYDWAITGECTAYSWEAGSVTSMGTSVQYGYVAVNPNVIPYGSLLYITSPNGEWNYGYCYAMDTGGAAMSGRIVADLFYDSEDYCNEFGRRQMTVYVIEESKWPDGWK